MPALIVALLMERQRKRQNADSLPYTLGLLFSLNALFTGILLLVYHSVWLISHNPSGSIWRLLSGFVFIAAGAYGLRRERAGLIASILLTLNPLWYIIALVYIPPRWKELGGDSSGVDADGRIRRRVYRNKY